MKLLTDTGTTTNREEQTDSQALLVEVTRKAIVMHGHLKAVRRRSRL